MSNDALYRQAVELIAKMDSDSRTRLMSYLKSIGAVTKVVHFNNSDALEDKTPVDVLVEFIEDSGGKSIPSYALERTNEFRWHKPKISSAWSWACKVARIKVERQSVFLFGCKCLRERLLTRGIPVRLKGEKGWYYKKFEVVGLRDMLLYMDHMSSSVEAGFPGYTKAGLIRSVALGELH